MPWGISSRGEIVFGMDTKGIDVGLISGRPNIVVVDNGGFEYYGPDYASGAIGSVTGTAVKDEFHGG